MKRIVLVSLLVFNLAADEIERIENIVKDVGELRQKYEACRDKLDKIETAPQQCAVNEIELKARHQEILSLQDHYQECQKKLETSKKTFSQSNTQMVKLAALEKRYETLEREHTALKATHMKMEHDFRAIKAQNKVSASAQKQQGDQDTTVKNELKEQQQRYASLQKELTLLQQKYVQLQQRLKQDNTPKIASKESDFPKLTMQPQYEALEEERASTIWTEAKTYRVHKDADIYEAPEGKSIDRWKAMTSFTSMQKEGKWIRITGYFVDKKWHSARDVSLWIRQSDVIER